LKGVNTTLVVCCVYFWSENQGIVVMAATATEDPRALLEELLVEPVIGNGLSLEEMRKFFPSKFRETAIVKRTHQDFKRQRVVANNAVAERLVLALAELASNSERDLNEATEFLEREIQVISEELEREERHGTRLHEEVQSIMEELKGLEQLIVAPADTLEIEHAQELLGLLNRLAGPQAQDVDRDL